MRRVIDSKVAAPAVLAVARQAAESPGPGNTLNSRQREVLRLVAEGLSNREIAVRTNLSEHTVKGYVEDLNASAHAMGSARRSSPPSKA